MQHPKMSNGCNVEVAYLMCCAQG